VADYSQSLEGRLRALAFAHDQSLSSVVGGDLGTLVEAEAGLHRYGVNSQRVVAAGVRLKLNDRAFGVMALAIHELMTNAAKYGALSVPEGKLDISWSLSPEGDCTIDWTETDGPVVQPPTRQGFGSKLIQTTIVYDLGGRADIHYAPSGMTARLLIPARHVTLANDVEPSLAEESVLDERTSIAGQTFLLVEDQSLIALDTEELLRRLGARDVRLSPDAQHAILTLGSFRPDAAILDFNLGDETSEKVADHLTAMGVPFVFATGYGDTVLIPDHLREVPVVRKPASVGSLLSEIGEAQRRLSGT
jgi:two-component sensor histidine kinase/CheY-like chemotaxis protein